MERLTRFEKARLISARSLQLALGAPVLVKIPHEMPLAEIAKLEITEHVLPLTVLRKYPSGEIRRIAVS